MGTATQASSRDVRNPGLVGAVLAAGTLLVAFRDPHQGGYLFCPVLHWTGIACVTCGGLRTVHDLTRLDIAGAWAMNPLLTVALPILALVWAMWLWRTVRGRAAWHPPTWMWIGIGIVLAAFQIARIFPALAPYVGPA
ncbi:MAG: DUF2752 domain-containing protein [Beutenbergiaceae bacterium]